MMMDSGAKGNEEEGKAVKPAWARMFARTGRHQRRRSCKCSCRQSDEDSESRDQE